METVSESTGHGVSDEAYIAYRSTHENSPKIPRMIVDLIRMHLAKKEYLLARFYCDEYRRDFPSGSQREEVEYLRLKALYLRALSRVSDERLLEQVDAEKAAFATLYPHSRYRTKIAKLAERLRTARNERYRQLANYYAKRGKPKAAQFYRDKIVY
jgi:outer membrane protein assembly factor BamD